MKIISAISIVFLVFLFGVVVYLAFQNRDSVALHSKLIPALVITIVGGFFTIWFSLKSESVDLQFISTIFFHKSDKKPLDEHEDRRHTYGGEQFDVRLQVFLRNHIENDENLKKGDFNKIGDEVRNLYFDMVFIKLFARFFWMYADWWDISINSVRRGNTFTTNIHPIKPDPDCDHIEWKDLLRALDIKSDFSQLLSSFSEDYWIKKMTVPPKTKVDFVTSRDRRALVLTNPFTRVSINIRKRSGSMGLGDYRWLLGYNNKKSEEFWSEHFEVTCKAKFEKFRSGHPKMARYKRWVETMFAEIQYQLDDEKRLKRARDYRDLISNSR